MLLFTYRKVVKRPTPTAKPGERREQVWNVVFSGHVQYRGSVWTVPTKSMLDDQFSTQYDEKRKALLEPAEETTELGQGSAGLSGVQIRIWRVEVRLWIRVVLLSTVSVWLRMGVAVGVHSAPSGWGGSAGLPGPTSHGYPHLIALRAGGSRTRHWRPGDKLWLQSKG